MTEAVEKRREKLARHAEKDHLPTSDLAAALLELADETEA